jgi:hypothetical protein
VDQVVVHPDTMQIVDWAQPVKVIMVEIRVVIGTLVVAVALAQ